MSTPGTEQPTDGARERTPREPSQTGSEPARARRLLLPLLPVAVIVGVLAGVTAAIVHVKTKPSLPGNASAARSSQFTGQVLTPARAAPPIALRNYLGQPVTLGEYRGKAVLVTFLYAHCPDVCPLIAANLRATLGVLGAKAGLAQIIAVSVDPKGDAPPTVTDFLRQHDMTGRMQYLIGSTHQLARVWSAWYVGTERDASNPAQVAHTALVYGITAGGRLLTIYPANYRPAALARDVPLLARR